MPAEDETGRPTAPLSPWQQIEAILHEYDTLRDEAIENVGRQQGFQSMIIVGLITFLGVASMQTNHYLIVFLPIALIIIAALEAGRQFSLLAKARYLAVLEDQINRLAGKDLLAWQSSLNLGIQMPRLRIRRLKAQHPLVNTNLLVSSIYPASLIILFIMSISLGAIYLHHNPPIASRYGSLAIILYVVIHSSLLGLILYSRLVHERRLLDAYEEIVREARHLD